MEAKHVTYPPQPAHPIVPLGAPDDSVGLTWCPWPGHRKSIRAIYCLYHNGPEGGSVLTCERHFSDAMFSRGFSKPVEVYHSPRGLWKWPSGDPS